MPDNALPTPTDGVPSPLSKLPPRGYQQEMLDQSLRRNIVVALDTGAGKTHIAVLRMKHEIERESPKVCATVLSFHPARHNFSPTRRELSSIPPYSYAPIPHPYTGLLVPRTDSCTRATAARRHRGTPPRLRRSHFRRERAGSVEEPEAVAWRAEHSPRRRHHARRAPERAPPWLHPPWARYRLACVRRGASRCGQAFV